MPDFNSTLARQIRAFEKITAYVIRIDILEDGKYLTASSITDSGIVNTELPLEDIVYLTEYGTATFPGKFILEHIVNFVSDRLDKLIDDVYSAIFEYEKLDFDIDAAFKIFENEINSEIENYLGGYYESVRFLSPLPGENRDISYLMDISLLKKYIRCKISKK